ncbi:hypothetical protein LLG46_12900 [bacterium]|nr:hypothetical protein [bacterium]
MCKRRRAVCVALALAAVMMISASAAWGVYEREYAGSEDLSAGLQNNISYYSSQGGLRLNDCKMQIPFLWVPSHAADTVTRIDARTGYETARYQIGPAKGDWDPCAVAVDSNGNAYVACMDQSSTGKVVRISASRADSNHDGYSATSSDVNGDGTISASETMPWKTDDCVGPVFEVGDKHAMPTSIAFDNSGFLWVTLNGDAQAVKMDPKTGKVLAKVDLVGRPTSIIAGSGSSMWILSRDQGILCQVNTVACALVASYTLDDCVPVSICKGENGKLWISNLNGGMIEFDAESGTWATSESDDGGYSSIVLDKNGDLWAACPDTGNVICLSGQDCTVMARIPVGGEPTTLSMDNDGYLWVMCNANGSVVKINVNSEEKLNVVNMGTWIHSSTPFTACSTKSGVCPQGTWRLLVDSEIEGAGWGIIDWSVQNIGGSVDVQVRTADDPAVINSREYVPVASGVKFTVPEGRYMEVMVTFDSNGDASPILYGLHVEGVNLAPKVENAWPSVAKILKRDHTLEPVSIEGVYDPEGDDFDIEITKVEQDEPVIGLGKDDLAPDAICLDGSSVWLRGECDPGIADSASDGRVYVVSFRAVDEYGSASSGKVKVMVPPDDKESAVEDLAKYDSFSEPAKLLCANISGAI